MFHTNYEVVNWLAVWANGFSDASYFTVDAIILPVGISFYTFQTISYSVDIYRRKLTPLRSIFDFGFYVSFFPQLVAGPIVRAENFVPQITKPTRVTSDHFNKGSFMILKGLIKKMIFADYIAMHFMDQVFDAPEMYSGFTNIMALFGYSLQIYGDFSGYTDIAIGLALLMGFELPVNFKSPYKAINCGDFWKRWHISLSTWLRDYLYIPLGGNRKGTKASFIILGLILTGVIFALGNPIATTIIVGIVVTAWILARRIPIVANHINTNINLMLTMLIGGLWHGASWKFVLWGGLNGLGIVVYKYWRRVSPYEAASGWFVHAWKITLTFLFITYVRIYFRGESMEHIGKWYRQIANNMDWGNAIEVLTHYKIVFIIMLLGYITHWLPQGLKNAIERYYAVSPVFVKGLVVTVISVICYQAFSSDFQPFIYFQF